MDAGSPRVRRVARAVATVASVSGLLVISALLVMAVAALGRDGGTAAAQTAAHGGVTVERSSSDPAVAPAFPGTDPADPRTDAASPRERPGALLGVLADARASAWREATPALLHGADAPGSAAATRDAAAVSEVARAGLRYSGLRYTVAETETVSATARTAVIRARIDTGPYAVVGPSGSTPRPATAGDPVLVHLVRTDAGWRVSDIRPAR